MKARAVDFVSYLVKDMPESVKFYRDVLGLKLEGSDEGPFVEFDLGNVTLSLALASAIEEEFDIAKGNAWVAIAVDDIEAATKELKEKGITVEDPMDFGVCKMSQVKDPSGNTLMLHQRADGTAG